MIFGITGNIEKENLYEVIKDIGVFLLKKKTEFFIDSKIFTKSTENPYRKFSLPIT